MSKNEEDMKESRLTKYFLNKLAKSKSIADIREKGLNLDALKEPRVHAVNQASTSRPLFKAQDSPIKRDRSTNRN